MFGGATSAVAEMCGPAFLTLQALVAVEAEASTGPAVTIPRFFRRAVVMTELVGAKLTRANLCGTQKLKPSTKSTLNMGKYMHERYAIGQFQNPNNTDKVICRRNYAVPA